MLIYNHKNSVAQTKEMQKAIVKALFQINQEKYRLNKLTKASPTNCELILELGIADHDSFIYLDKEEMQKYRETLKTQDKPIHIVDFFCSARYYSKEAKRKRRPLKFDYTLLRFRFYPNNVELLFSHERGNQRLPLQDLGSFLAKRINAELKLAKLDGLNLIQIRPP